MTSLSLTIRALLGAALAVTLLSACDKRPADQPVTPSTAPADTTAPPAQSPPPAMPAPAETTPPPAQPDNPPPPTRQQ